MEWQTILNIILEMLGKTWCIFWLTIMITKGEEETFWLNLVSVAFFLSSVSIFFK